MDEPPRFLDKPENVRKLIRGFWIACALLLALDLGLYDRSHSHYDWERWFGFYGIYGFVACVALVESAKLLRRLVKRDSDYYEGDA